MDVDREEATIRLTSGLFIPSLIFFLDGLFLIFIGERYWGLIILIISFLISLLLYFGFSKRRHREILYVYYMAFIALKK